MQNEVPLKKAKINEASKRLSDGEAADKDCETLVAKWIEHKVKWKESLNKK